MARIQYLTSIAELEEILSPSHDRPVFLLKHSTRCPFSAAAMEQVAEYCSDFRHEGKLDFKVIHVIEERSLSNRVAQHFRIPHQSPQLILIWKGTALWHDSHRRIAKSRIAEVVQQYLAL